ncbi:hypothetical protein SCRM01_283 [Synechococcus phage S-CRM01]|uniref:hypothetical protein n=1 Tax=Synechococcus phage S-CRM01 TaxID=1026955 RepID=UPI000209E317|nr:hypothetical protein SCRM01_283 [Synechococcus phage S-CRM01]AEC53229.1 hypothetical protein SCRM01_283 [Synechococcus phage S-CRM01]
MSSDGGRIGRIGWTNRKTTYTYGHIWWSKFWPWPYPFIILSADGKRKFKATWTD